LITATVLGSGGQPFANAGVYFTTPLGTFASGSSTSAILKTNSAGQATDTLSIEDVDLLNFVGNSFAVTAHLGVEGGEKTASITFNIQPGPAPSLAESVILTSDASFITDDATDQSLELTAFVQDQFGDPFEGGVVTFSSSFASAVFAPTTDSSDSDGKVSSMVTFDALDVAAVKLNGG
jgi:hypothetical protein